jgi:hypothetical protein
MQNARLRASGTPFRAIQRSVYATLAAPSIRHEAVQPMGGRHSLALLLLWVRRSIDFCRAFEDIGFVGG